MGEPCATGGRVNGALCPEYEHAPQTAEGVWALRACNRPGVLVRAGLAGTITGLDLAAALATVEAFGAGCERETLAELLLEIETGAVVASARKDQPLN